MKKILWFFAALFACSVSAMARPVSYPGGWTVMQFNDAYKHSLHVHVSPTAKYSIGYKAEYWRDGEWAVPWCAAELLGETMEC